MITVYQKTSPFDKKTVEKQWEFHIGMTANEIVRNYEINYKRIEHSRYGRIPHYDLESTCLQDGDTLTIMPQVRTSVLGPRLFNTALQAVVAGVSSKYAHRQIKKFFKSLHPSVKAPLGSGAGDGDSSATYGWDGIQTLAEIGTPIPIVYGTHYVGGNLINSYVDEDGGKSYLNILLALCEGKVKSIAGSEIDDDELDLDTIGDKILIEDNPIRNFKGAKVYVRLGNDVQESVEGFDDLAEIFTIPSTQLAKNVPYVRATQNSEVDKLTLEFTHNSLIQFDDEGATSFEYKADIYVKPYNSDDSNYVKLGTYKKEGKSTSAIIGYWEAIMPSRGRWDLKINQITANSAVDKRACDTFITKVVEKKSEKLSYPRTALIALKLLATSQISGTLPNIKTLVQGLEVYQIEELDDTPFKAWSNNPIWCLNDAITNDFYGLGSSAIDPTDYNQLVTESQYCEEILNGDKRFQLDIVLDTEQRGTDTINSIASTFRCFPVYYDKKINLTIEKKEDILSCVFNMSNIKKGTYKQAWRPLSEQIDYMSVEFLDKDAFYKRDSIPVEDRDALIARKRIRKETLFLRGVTRRAQAGRMGKYVINSTKYYPRTESFEASIDSLDTVAGSVIGLQHDVPGYGVLGGRIKSATTNTFKLYNNLILTPLTGGKKYQVLVVHRNGDTELKELTLQTGTFPANTAISIVGTWTNTPQRYELANVGEEDILVKKFRVVSTKLKNNQDIAVVLEEYPTANEDAFYDGTDTPINPINESTLPNPTLAPDFATDLSAFSVPSYYPIVLLSYKKPAVNKNYGFFSYAEVYISQDNGKSWTLYGDDRDGVAEIAGLVPNTEYDFKIVSVSTRGRKSDFADSPVLSFTPIPAIPPDVRGLELKDQGNDVIYNTIDANFVWKPVRSTETASAGVGDEPNGAGAGALNEYIVGYIVQMLDTDMQDDGIKEFVYLRQEYTTLEQYSYTFAKNSEDHYPNQPERKMIIRVWAYDKFGQKSLYPAILTVENPIPTMVEDAQYGIFNVETISGTTYRSSEVYWTLKPDADIKGYKVFYSPLGDPVTDIDVPIFDGQADSINFYKAQNDTVGVYWIAPYDYFPATNTQLNYFQVFAL